MAHNFTTYFESVNDLASHLLAVNERFKEPIRMNKGLYFLNAIYAGTVAADKEQSDDFNDCSDYLFYSRIEAWEFVPVIREVYDKYNTDNEPYASRLYKFGNNGVDEYVKDIIERVLVVIDDMSELDLVMRTQDDQCWVQARNRESYKFKDSGVVEAIDYNAMKRDYKKDYT